MHAYLKSTLTTLAALVLLSACWEPTEFEVLRVVPGVISLPGARTLAVGEMTGPGSDRVGHHVAEGLIAQNRFSVLDWSSPHGMGQYGGGWADAQGGWKTADAAILGSVFAPVMTPEYEARHARTMDGTQVTTYSRSWHMEITGIFRVLDPHNGLILSSTTVTGESHSPEEYSTVAGAPADSGDSAFIDSLFPPAPYDVLQELALGALADELVGLLDTTLEKARVVLFHEAHNAEFKAVLQQAVQGRWQQAVDAYGKAVLDYEEHAPSLAYMAHHNHGVALACNGELDAGIKELQTAYSMHRHTATAQALAQVRAFHEASLAAQVGSQVKR